MSTIACRVCGERFHPSRRAGRNTGRGRRTREASYTAARYCSDRCRKAASRARFSRDQQTEKTAPPTIPFSAVTSPLQAIEISREIPTKKTIEHHPKLDPRIVPDPNWKGMYRIKLPDGLSDMLNLTRARDAARFT